MKLTKAKVVRTLQIARVLDESGNLSLTNIALVAVLARTLMIPQLTVHDLATFLAVVVGYQVKRFAQPVGAPDDTAALKAAVADLQTKTTALQLNGQLRR